MALLSVRVLSPLEYLHVATHQGLVMTDIPTIGRAWGMRRLLVFMTRRRIRIALEGVPITITLLGLVAASRGIRGIIMR